MAAFSGPPTGSQDLYTKIKIRGFFFREGSAAWVQIGRRVSGVTWYESISGEEFSPCRQVLFQAAIQKFYRRSGTIPGAHHPGISPSFPLAWRSPQLTIGIIAPPVSPGSIKACWSPAFKSAGSDRALPNGCSSCKQIFAYSPG